MLSHWHPVSNIHEIDSPALLLYHDRVAENLRRTIAMAGGSTNLRPHVKTHKCAEVLRMKLAGGITKFKCATIAEAEMCAAAGCPDVLLAYQPVGPRAERFAQLVSQFPATVFSCIVDDPATVDALAHLAAARNQRIRVFIDIDCGQQRTGIPPGTQALDLHSRILSKPALEYCGLHAYDGHIHDDDVATRRQHCDTAFAPVEALRESIIAAGHPSPLIVAGGTPTFPFHARRVNVECSPGTNIFWDAGYASHFPDLDFLPAVLLLARVVSRPGPNRICLDCGHKAIASESPHPRIFFPELLNPKVVTHNEEHLVYEADNAASIPVGAPLYGIPKHICPTVALHQELVVIKNGMAVERWKVTARDRRLTI